MPEKSKSCEIRLTRLYDAPVKAVWDAWTDPDQVGKWWGPRGYSITTHSKDLRVGGHWNFTMHGPDGVDYPNTTHYLEIEKHARLVYDHGGSADRPPMFRVTVLFYDVDGRTRMDMTMALPTPEAVENTRKIIKKAGGDSTWDRLAEYLGKQVNGVEQFVINRTFDAPIDLMFQMWTDPKHFSQWLPPTGFKMEFVRCDIRPGGMGFYFMSGMGAAKMYGTVHYREIAKPGRIVYTQQFSDEHGNIARHPMSPNWPQTMLTTVRLSEEGRDRTRVTVVWEPVAPTAAEVETFTNARAGMSQGWGGSFEKLEAYLANQQSPDGRTI